MPEKTYLQAISDGLRQEMRRDARVFVLGEDVGVYGGAFKVTRRLPGGVRRLARDRHAAVRDRDRRRRDRRGAAGHAPVAEMQFADFISCAMDQIVTAPPRSATEPAPRCRW